MKLSQVEPQPLWKNTYISMHVFVNGIVFVLGLLFSGLSCFFIRNVFQFEINATGFLTKTENLLFLPFIQRIQLRHKKTLYILIEICRIQLKSKMSMEKIIH